MAHQGPRGIWLRALLYMFIIGLGWLVILPIVMLTLEHGSPIIELRSTPFALAGFVIVDVGVLLALASGYHLIMHGRGTPLPLDPPEGLVTTGPYAYVRNPQAIAMVLMVSGEILALRSTWLWLLLPLTLLYLEGLVGPWEERQLLTRHGERYLDYKHRVRKWRPGTTRYVAR